MTSHVPTSGFVCFVLKKAKSFNVKQIENETVSCLMVQNKGQIS